MHGQNFLSRLVVGLLAICITAASSFVQAQDDDRDENDNRRNPNVQAIEDRIEGVARRLNSNNLTVDVAPPPLYGRARALFYRGDIPEAIALLNQLLLAADTRGTMRHRLGRIPIHTLLGECHLQAGDLVTAGENYQAALNVVVENPQFISGIAWGELHLDRPEDLGFSIRDVAWGNMQPPERSRRRTLPTNELWPSANLVPLALLRQYMMAGVPPGRWEVLTDDTEDFAQRHGLDVAETMRQLSLSAYRLRWLRGRAAVLMDATGQQLMNATVPPGPLGHEAEFRAAGTLVASSRTAIRFYAGDDSDQHLEDPTDTIDDEFHPLTPISRLTRMRSRRNQWDLLRRLQSGIEPMREGQAVVVMPAREDLNQLIETAIVTSDIAFAQEQMQLGVDCFDEALEELSHWNERAELAGQLENALVMRSERLRSTAPSIAYQLRVHAARAALLRGSAEHTQGHLTSAERFRQTRRLNLPRSQAFARWIRLQNDTVFWGRATRLQEQGDPDQVAQPTKQLDRLTRARTSWKQVLEELRLFSSGVNSNRSPNTGRMITHPLGFRFTLLGDPRSDRVPIATRSQLYHAHWQESLASVDSTSFDRFCFEMQRSDWTRHGVELAIRADEGERVVLRLEEHLAARARSALDDLPGMTDLRCALREELVAKDLRKNNVVAEGRGLEGRLPNHPELRRQLSAVEPWMQLNPTAIGVNAAIVHERLQAYLAKLALTTSDLPRVVPPPIKQIKQRPDWDSIPNDTAVIAFYVNSNRVTGTMVHRGLASHWDIGSTGEIIGQCENWLRTILTLPTMVDELKDEAERDRIWQLELEVAQRLFPPLSGFDHPDIRRIVVVPDQFLWQIPFEQLVVAHENAPTRRRWSEAYDVTYAHTIGTAMEMIQRPKQKLAEPDGASVAIMDARSASTAMPLDEAAPANIVPGPVGTWGDPVWWPIISTHVVVASDSDRRMGIVDGLNAWERRMPSTGKTTVSSWCEVGSPIESRPQSSSWLQPEIDEFLFRRISLLHASGVQDVVLPRWYSVGQAGNVMADEMSMELGQVPFAEAWNRSKEIAKRMEFAFPVGVNSVPLKDRNGRVTGAHPVIQLPHVYLPFSGF
ncbi:CHAT domain-containing protein [Rhodopirellula sp. JC740]|uniref:CHAT domain-containing protein n=1 Tax=Rhodopirellula halodulae TaxID=2894198 RepID=A0ABS8NDD8_9BACT|nr:CHAT domain-containing protein [Rhodopirellula sp. JC740]